MLGLICLSYKVHKTTVIWTIFVQTERLRFSADLGCFDGMFDFSLVVLTICSVFKQLNTAVIIKYKTLV